MDTRKTFKTAGLAALALAGTGLHNAAAATSVQLNGQPLATSVAPIQRNNRTLVPMRDIFEALGAQVRWDNLTRGITAQRGATTVGMQIGNRFATINGRRAVLEQAPILYRGSTLVPLRFVSEAMGAQVGWNNSLQLVSISTNGALPGSGSAVAGVRTISVPTGAVVPVTLDTAITSAAARVGDVFYASVVSENRGDSEFPAGTKVQGVITEVQRKSGDDPGVLDIDFRAAVLPNGTRVPLRGDLIALDNDNVTSTTQGRIMAKSGGKTDLKVIGIGAGLGFVLGKVLDKNTLVTTILGAAGGYLYDRKKDKAAEAQLNAGTKLGVSLTSPVTYADTTGYAEQRAAFLR